MRSDRLEPLPPSLSPLSGAALKATLASPSAATLGAERTLLEAVLLSLPLRREPSSSVDAEIEAARALLGWLRETAAGDFSSSLEEDEKALEELRAKRSVREGVDEEGADEEMRTAMILTYRIGRKRLWALAEKVLEAHVEVQLGKRDTKDNQA